VSVRLTVSGSFYDNFGQKVKCKRNVPTVKKKEKLKWVLVIKRLNFKANFKKNKLCCAAFSFQFSK